MIFPISDFASRFQRGSLQKEYFQVFITNPVNSSADRDVSFLAYASTLPKNLAITTIDASYFGRPVGFATVQGDRSGTWTVDIYEDETFKIRDTLEQWINAVSLPLSNIQTTATANLKSTGSCTLYEKTGLPVRTWNYFGIYPTSVSSIGTLDWSKTDAQPNLTVAFSYDNYEVIDVA